MTGGLGAFGYYILLVYALSFSSVTFVSIMGGVLPVLALLTLFFFPTFKILAPLTISCVLELVAVVIFATILPYQLYLKGSKAISISTASMYLNLLPVTSLLPVLLTGTLKLNMYQAAGIILLILSAVIGREPSETSPHSVQNT